MKVKCDICEKRKYVSNMYVVEINSYKSKHICEECMEEKDYWDESYYPLEEDYEYMDEEEKEGWDSIIEKWNKD
jgi:hypothetical protein